MSASTVANAPRWWWAINLFVPGTGLIAAQREWLGLSIALLFGICGQATLAGALLAPLAIPRWTTLLTATLAVAAWLAAQWLLRRRVREQFSPPQRTQMEHLLADARTAADAGRLDDALAAVESALSTDDEHLEAAVLRATLISRTSAAGAAAAWRRVAALDRSGRFRAAVEQGLRGGRNG